jgi:hypothetical protein
VSALSQAKFMRRLRLIATAGLVASVQSVFADSGSAPVPSAKPAAAVPAAGDVTEQGCKLSGAIRLKAVPTAVGSVSLSGGPAVLCSFAQEFSGWVRDVAAPLALGYMGQRLARIETGEAFACRARYDKPGAIPSEHAKGNAVDIAAFVLADGRRIYVKQQDGGTARDFVHALRMTACGYFTTVLGPGTDPAHEAHFHFDSSLHGATPNYRVPLQRY